MSRRNQLAGIDPLANNPSADQPSTERPSMSLMEADAALFGQLERREGPRQTVQPISIFSIYPDIKQPRRAIPLPVRERWSGEPADIPALFAFWIHSIHQERADLGRSAFQLDSYLWDEAITAQQRPEDEIEQQLLGQSVGPLERALLQVIALAVSIRRDGLANPVTIMRWDRQRYQIETGERRWLAYHLLHHFFDGQAGRPDERSKWERLPSIVVDSFNVWRQASENSARADLNAIGRARQFALLMMDLVGEQGIGFQPYEQLVAGGQSDRSYYAQVIPYRVPKGKGEMLSNGLGVAHRAAFTRCRTLLGLPDEVWSIGDTFSFTEDELLRLAKIQPPERAIEEAHRLAIVATRNNSTKITPDNAATPPPLPVDPALKRGKKLFSRHQERLARDLLSLRSGVGEANPDTKHYLYQKITELRQCLDLLEQSLGE